MIATRTLSDCMGTPIQNRTTPFDISDRNPGDIRIRDYQSIDTGGMSSKAWRVAMVIVLDFYHVDFIIWILSFGFYHGDFIIWILSLGFHHWDFIIGILSLGFYHWVCR